MRCGEYFPDAVYALAGNAARLEDVCSERRVEVVRCVLRSDETTKVTRSEMSVCLRNSRGSK
jgi:hypothetical protein